MADYNVPLMCQNGGIPPLNVDRLLQLVHGRSNESQLGGRGDARPTCHGGDFRLQLLQLGLGSHHLSLLDVLPCKCQQPVMKRNIAQVWLEVMPHQVTSNIKLHSQGFI